MPLLFRHLSVLSGVASIVILVAAGMGEPVLDTTLHSGLVSLIAGVASVFFWAFAGLLQRVRRISTLLRPPPLEDYASENREEKDEELPPFLGRMDIGKGKTSESPSTR